MPFLSKRDKTTYGSTQRVPHYDSSRHTLVCLTHNIIRRLHRIFKSNVETKTGKYMLVKKVKKSFLGFKT